MVEIRSDWVAWRLACMASALARALRGSISMRNWPLLTRSPSLTASRVTWPMTFAEMSALVTAWTLPLALTFDWRFSRPTVATCTPMPLSLMPARLRPPIRTTARPPPRIHSFFRFMSKASPRG